ncbi:MAG: segregation and condensation protein A [Candidatus Binatia bacterium]
MSATPDYRVALEAYNGPLDLLLFLIKRDEVDIYDIPIARITEQYLEYAEVIQQLDPETVGQFLVLAATLMEVKSRMLLPKPPIEEDEEDDSFDPRFELVRQLLEYKKFKDAARTLDARAQEQSHKFPRKPSLPPTEEDEIEIENLDVWNLFEAFNSLLKQIGASGYKHKVGVDDTPIALLAEDVLDSLERAGGTQRFEEVFAGRDRAEMIGLFLALLELIRQQRIRVTQDRPFAPITIVMLDRTPLDAVSDFDTNEEDEDPADTERLFSLSPIDDEPVEEDADDEDLAAIERALDEFTASDGAKSESGGATETIDET